MKTLFLTKQRAGEYRRVINLGLLEVWKADFENAPFSYYIRTFKLALK